MLNRISRSIEGRSRRPPGREIGILDGHGGASSKTSAVSLLSAFFEWKCGGDSTRDSRASNVVLLIGAMGEDFSSVGRIILGYAYSVSVWDK